MAPSTPIKAITRIGSLDDLVKYCFTALGWPVINVEIEQSQALDRVYDALQFYGEEHYNGTQEVWFKHEFTAKDEAHNKIHLPSDIVGVLELYDPSVKNGMGSADDFDRINYLIANSDIFYLSQSGYGYERDLKNYDLTMSYIRLLKIYFNPVRDYQFSLGTGEMIVPSGVIKEGNYIMIRALRMIDPEKHTRALNEIWVKKYATALFKRQWGTNLKKFDGVEMAGSVTVQGQKIYDEAVAEIEKLEEEFISKNTLPFGPMWG